MQSAKDTFLMTLRDRLAVVNPARVVAVRGATRPAVIAGEDELPAAAGDPLDCFVLRWVEETRDATEPLPLHTMRCEIRYATRGTGEFAGMDRGRVLSAMERELERVLQPRSAPRKDYTQTPAALVTTRAFWSDAEPGAMTAVGDRVQAVATVTVCALEEGRG